MGDVTIVEGPDALRALKGQDLGYGPWRTVTQEQVNTFADATDDHQWIHVDVERAKAGPFGSTIAHGYLTLSLIPSFVRDIVQFQGFTLGLNYGLNTVRFPAPVPVGSQLRAGVKVIDVTDAGSALQIVMRITIEVEGGTKPVCVAEMVFRYVP